MKENSINSFKFLLNSDRSWWSSELSEPRRVLDCHWSDVAMWTQRVSCWTHANQILSRLDSIDEAERLCHLHRTHLHHVTPWENRCKFKLCQTISEARINIKLIVFIVDNAIIIWGSKTTSCGLANEQTSINSPNEFPWQVYLLVNRAGDFSSCVGILIDSQWVLTAARCFDSGSNRLYW